MAVSSDGVFATPFNDWSFPNPVFAFGFDFSEVAAGFASVLIDDGSGPVGFELYDGGEDYSVSAGSTLSHSIRMLAFFPDKSPTI
tara:strand:- start:394 stop:648 length:255 start_codon:yes stop_codon:yes gene_type:complete